MQSAPYWMTFTLVCLLLRWLKLEIQTKAFFILSCLHRATPNGPWLWKNYIMSWIRSTNENNTHVLVVEKWITRDKGGGNIRMNINSFQKWAHSHSHPHPWHFRLFFHKGWLGVDVYALLVADFHDDNFNRWE